MPSTADAVGTSEIAHDLRRAQEPEHLFKLLKDFGFTDADIAQVTGTQTRTVRRWKSSPPGPFAAQRLAELRNVVVTVRDTGGLTDRGMVFWLRHRNRLLEDYPPASVLAAGGFRSVQDAALCFVDTQRGFTKPIPAAVLKRLRDDEAEQQDDPRARGGSQRLMPVA